MFNIKSDSRTRRVCIVKPSILYLSLNFLKLLLFINLTLTQNRELRNHEF